MLVIDIWQLMFPELPQRTCHSTMTNKLFPRFMLTIKVPCISYRELNIEMFTRKRNQAEWPKIKKKKGKLEINSMEKRSSYRPLTVHCVYSVQSYVSPFTIVFHSCHKDTRDANRVERCLQSVTKTEYRVNNIHRLDFFHRSSYSPYL